MELDYLPWLDICALFYIFTLSWFFFRKEKIYTMTSAFYGMMLIGVSVNVLFDTISVWTITYSDRIPVWINQVVNVPIFVSNVIIGVSFMLMSMSMAGVLPEERGKNAWGLKLLLVPCIVGLAVSLSTPFTGAIYYFDSEMKYTHGPFFSWLYGIAAFYVVVGIFTVTKYRRAIPKVQCAVLYIFVEITLLAMVVQYIYPVFLVIGAAMTLSLISMYMTFQNPDAYIDKQTYLFNRDAFIVRTQRIFRRQGDDTVLLVVCLTGLKNVNNRVGFASGDELLTSVAKWLSFICDGKGGAFRISGSTFVIVARRENADLLMETVQERFAGKWRSGSCAQHIPFVVCRMDVADRAENHADMMKLLENVTELAKSMEDGSCVNVDDTVVMRVARRDRIEKLLREREQNNCISLYWQPIYAVRTERITHVEVLMRMSDSELGFVPPDEFIDVAEKSGAILGLGLWVLDQTCRFIEENRVWERGLRIIAVNLSMMECVQPNAAAQILEVLGRYPRARHYIGLEITETTLATSAKEVVDMMSELSESGVQFALDDYGCGWSNCESVIKFPFTGIKMDKGLLWSAMKDPRAMTLYRNSVRMFKEMGFMVIAEGAESKEHLQFLEEAGVDFIQGYYFSKPLPRDDFMKLPLEDKA